MATSYEDLHPQRQLTETAKSLRSWLDPAVLRPLLRDENLPEETDDDWVARLEAAIAEFEEMGGEIVRLLRDHIRVVRSTDDDWEADY